MKPARNVVRKRSFTPVPFCQFCGEKRDLLISAGVRKVSARCRDIQACRDRVIRADRSAFGAIATRPEPPSAFRWEREEGE